MSVDKQVTEVLNEKLKREYLVSIPIKDINNIKNDRLKELSKTTVIKGFRKGKVPIQMLEKKYGASVLAEITEKAINETSQEVIKEKKLIPITEAKLEVKTFEPDKDIEYSISLEVSPEFDILDFKSINVDHFKIKPNNKNIEQTVSSILERNKEYEPIKTSRAAKEKDQVLIDYIGKVDNVEFEGGSATDTKLILGSGQFIPGYEEQLIGSKKGDNVLVKVKFPKGYHKKELSEKDVEFEVTVKDILQEKKLELNEEFVKKFNCTSVEEFNSNISKMLEEEYKELSRTHLKKDIFDKIDSHYDFELPESMVNSEIQALSSQQKQTPDDEENLTEEEIKKLSKRRVLLGIFLLKISQEQGITATNEEVKLALIKQSQSFPGSEKQIIEFYKNNKMALEKLKAPIVEEKVVDYIIDKINISEKEIDIDEFNKISDDVSF